MYDDNFDFDDKTVIKIVGVGGGGSNAINCIVNAGLKGVEFITVDTDKNA
ncbi:MAG: cell division protein FtsZ, partial [Selenomonadaceae bacterium]|nr:cell division protein FtsZ [Selenomonadaceae bacterium]